jgi:hypothetical protein
MRVSAGYPSWGRNLTDAGPGDIESAEDREVDASDESARSYARKILPGRDHRRAGQHSVMYPGVIRRAGLSHIGVKIGLRRVGR